MKDGATTYTELDRLFPYASSKLDLDSIKKMYKRFDANSDG